MERSLTLLMKEMDSEQPHSTLQQEMLVSETKTCIKTMIAVRSLINRLSRISLIITAKVRNHANLLPKIQLFLELLNSKMTENVMIRDLTSLSNTPVNKTKLTKRPNMTRLLSLLPLSCLLLLSTSS